MTIKKDGKVTLNGKVKVSADGKNRAVTINGTDKDGKKIHSMSAYDKE